MKITIDARFFGTETGIGRYVKELTENLEIIDKENQYVVFLSAKNFDLYRPQNPNFQKKLVDIKWYSLEEQMKMGKTIDAEKADLAHFPHWNMPVFCKTPYVITIHDLILRHFPTSAASTKNPVIFYLKYFFYNLILWNALRRARKIIVPSYFVKNDILSVIPDARAERARYSGIQKNNNWIPGQARNDILMADKIRIISEGLSNLPPVDFGKEFLESKGVSGPYILHVGNCYPHKNLEKLIEAMKILNKPDLKLVLVGKRDYFSRRLENYELSDKIIFYGYAPDEELATLYKNASLYVFPSLMEGFGLSPLEALSFGLPSAVSDIPIFHEILGESAFYFNPRDAGDMARIIAGGLHNNELRDKIIEEGRKILQRYDWRKNAEETLQVYGKIFS